MTSPQTDRQQSVLDLLQNLKGQDPLKKLFWTELNYDKVNSPLSRKGWGEQASSALADDPVLFATGGKDFHVIHARLKSDRPLLGMERPVVSRLLQDHPYALFVFSNASQDQWHFLNVKYDDDVQKRRIFRRIAIGPQEKLRTASERLDKINLADATNLAPNTIQKLHDDAFDVEPVTKEFFHEYGRIFDEVEGAIKGIRDEERKHLFTQRLFNRLMFIAFIQKKGWLKFGGSTDYLSALWKAHVRDNTVANKNFYRDRLKPLFFFGLNGGSQETDVANINRGGFLKSLIGEVPYLNGGLFDQDDDDKDEKIVLPDPAIAVVLNDLFARFNFTVTESTPLDVEVAVDPEMLGKIFEELVTGRHETGSYYTPKPIVAFMCREALKGYLATQVTGESKDALEEFVDEHKPQKLHNAEAVLEALRKVKVCDPACGSGAYLVGMQHELLDLRACLFATAKLDSKSVYDRKLEIIQNNLYGVDLDQFAVNIARLRLWLSLSVDFEGQNPPPLPNLDYKVEAGDTICSPNPSGGLEMGFRKALIDEYLKAKSDYMTAHHGQKGELRQHIEKARADIASWSHRDEKGFDWPIEFAEVFVGSGFDVVLANPPYVRQELIKEIKPRLAKVYPAVYSGTADLYCYFYARGIELLRTGGMFVFISSNKWLRANYGTKLRDYMASQCSVRSITDFGELPVFESAATFPMILVAQKNQVEGKAIFTQVQSLQAPYPDVKAILTLNGHVLPEGAISGSKWNLTEASVAKRLRSMNERAVTLSKYSNADIYRGLITGLNEAFVIDDEERANLIRSDSRSREIIKPLAVGDDVRKWTIRSSDKWLIVTPIGIDVKKYPAVFEHLKRWKRELEKRWDKGDHWWELRPCDYYDLFDKPKIIFPDIAKEPRFSFSEKPLYATNTIYFIPTSDLYLLGVLNSDSIWMYAREHLTVLGDSAKGGRLRFFRQFVKEIPIPNASTEERKSIASLVEQCLDKQGKACDKIEAEINGRVAKLFGLGSTVADGVRG